MLVQTVLSQLDAPPLEAFKVRLDGSLTTLVYGRCPCLCRAGTRLSLRSLAIQTILWFYDCMLWICYARVY